MRNREHGAVFRQSLLDFPCPVRLGEKSPSFGLHRFRQGLRFLPVDDEGFTLRGDKQRLTYKGRRRSHRFTILNNTAFEYDCILHREPETNVIRLRIEGAEHFDFFRQPDFVKDPFLKGSYAVYKKETLIGEGTGKLCHIHRPEIIDARGRRCWGSLAVAGNELHITIPEQWLADAKYPVVVDPTIGNTTIGEFWQNFDSWNIEDGEIIYDEVFFEDEIAVNRYNFSETMNGTANVFFYTREGWNTNTYPVLYSGYDKPVNRLSSKEKKLAGNLPNYNEGWLSSTFDINLTYGGGNNTVWFGMLTNDFSPLYDFGSICYRSWLTYTWIMNNPATIPNVCPTQWIFNNENYKVSMYFTFGSGQNYVKKLTQGVKLTDSRKLKADYKRKTAQTLKVTTALSKVQKFIRQCLITVSNTMRLERIRGFLRSVIDQTGFFEEVNHKWEIKRKCVETAGIQWHKEQKQAFSREIKDNDNVNDYRKFTADYLRETYQTVQGSASANAFVIFFRQCLITVSNTMKFEQIQLFLRSVFDRTGIQEELQNRREIARGCKENAGVIGEVNRSKGFIREIFDNLTGTDNNDFNILFVRTVNETQGITDSIHKLGDYIRALYIEAGNIAETAHSGAYYRKESDRVQAEGLVLRQLSIFLRILTKTILRDYIIGRFLIAKEELRLKSCIVREIVLESKIN